MNTIIEYLKKFKELYIALTLVVGIISSLFWWGWKLESNQMHILKSVVYDFEKNQKCGTNRFEYDEYMVNYTSLYDLEKKHQYIRQFAIYAR